MPEATGLRRAGISLLEGLAALALEDRGHSGCQGSSVHCLEAGFAALQVLLRPGGPNMALDQIYNCEVLLARSQAAGWTWLTRTSAA